MTTTYGFGFDWARPRSSGARIARIDALATLLDTALVIPGAGVRFGLDALIGLFPVVGDIITTALSLFIVHEAYQLGAPGHVIARMLGNVALNGVFGAVPLVVATPTTCCGARTGGTCGCYGSGWTSAGGKPRRLRSPCRDVRHLHPSQPALDCLRRLVDGIRLGDRRRRHGDHHYRLALGESRVQHCRLHAAAVRLQGRTSQRIFRPRRHRHWSPRGDRQHRVAASRRMVVGARPSDHGDPARRDDSGHSVRLGASEARWTGAVADREGDRAGAERAAPVVFISRAPETVPRASGPNAVT